MLTRYINLPDHDRGGYGLNFDYLFIGILMDFIEKLITFSSLSLSSFFNAVLFKIER